MSEFKYVDSSELDIDKLRIYYNECIGLLAEEILTSDNSHNKIHKMNLILGTLGMLVKQ